MKLFGWMEPIPKTPEQKAALKRERLLLLLSAVVIALGFPPVPLPYLLFVGLVPYLMVIEGRNKLVDINRATFLMSFLLALFTIYWVGGFTQGKDSFLMIGGFILFFINPICFLIPSTLYYLWREYVHRKSALLVFPFFWLCYEYFYSATDWSFPWLNLHNGVSQFTSFIQIADIIGGWGLTILIIYANVFFYLAYRNWKINTAVEKQLRGQAIIYLIGAVGIIFLPVIYGVYQISTRSAAQSNAALTVGVVQPNIDPYDKWSESRYEKTLADLLADSKKLMESKPDVILWPETALPIYFSSPQYGETQDLVFNFARANSVNILTGMPDVVFYGENEKAPIDAKYSKTGKFFYATYNSVLGIRPDSRELQRYGKMKLVPFGERAPFVDALPFIADIIKWEVGISGWNVGKDTVVFNLKLRDGSPVKVGTVICYESIYSEVLTALANKGAQCLFIVTNDSWYGNTSGPYQHRDFARLRAVETRRYVVRCANGGVSCIINNMGQIEKQTNMYEHTLLSGTARLSNESTFYMQHPRWLLHIAITLSLVCLVLSFAAWIRKKIDNRILQEYSI